MNLLLLVKNVLFTVLVPGTVAVYVPLFAFDPALPEPSFVSLIAGILLLIGATVYAWCVWDFAVAGRGTPAPIDPPKTLVVRGLYRYARNPMYLGVLCVIGGWALLFQSASLFIYGICVATAFHLFVLLYEEPHLRSVFGGSYVDYCAKVRRWLPVPRQSPAS